MELTLVRHGDAHAGFTGPIGGERGCRGLTDLGRDQASRLADRLVREDRRPDVLLASRVPRAIETAEVIADALDLGDVERRCEWCEVHPGSADGVDWADHARSHGLFDMVAEPDREFAPGGDSWNGFHRRVDAAMHEAAARWPEQSVMVVCHAGVIAASIRIRFDSVLTSSVRLVPTHTGLTTWTRVGGVWALQRYDDAAHLDDDRPPGERR